MPDEDDRFGDIAEQLKQTAENEAADTSDVASEEDTQVSATESNQEPKEDYESKQLDESSAGPAFSFDETDMHGFYVRERTWNDVTRMRSSVTAACSMFDVPEFEGREFQDACLQVVSNHGDEVALQILRERGIEADEKQIEKVIDILSSQAESTQLEN